MAENHSTDLPAPRKAGRVRISTEVILATIVGAYRPYVDLPAFREGPAGVAPRRRPEPP